jgi:hypothetical protein
MQYVAELNEALMQCGRTYEVFHSGRGRTYDLTRAGLSDLCFINSFTY